jgi:hypothetical protein
MLAMPAWLSMWRHLPLWHPLTKTTVRLNYARRNNSGSLAMVTAIRRASSFQNTPLKKSIPDVKTIRFSADTDFCMTCSAPFAPYVGRTLEHSFATLDLRGPREVTDPSF